MVFGNLGKMGEMMKQARQIQAELKKMRFEEQTGGSRVLVNGEMEILELKIEPGSDGGKIKDIINRAMQKAKMESAKLLQKMTGGLSLPGM
ncbi:MAG TPA: YbaB/EbfC family nucleoid-associated protein [Candidatus Sulfotelmatobacter sp.]|nr:YbaB/EbfC family nucleoid-associated protein [Candidatus Sulfotelmatobacter sp.]